MNNEMLKAFVIAVISAPFVYMFLIIIMSLDVIFGL